MIHYNEGAIRHNREEFLADIINSKREKYGLNNSARIEIFLWDLEIFIQLQDILNDKIVLKGGAAAQFYLPIENQRTSVDIDIITSASEEEVSNAIKQIEEYFNGEDNVLKFRLHTPKEPKTNLHLKTFFVNVPSTINENGIQQIKCEFIFFDIPGINKITSPMLFACDTNFTYNVLPINYLIGDKLTTLGPNTIGIQDERSDEQIKQVYDLIELIENNLEKINIEEIKEYYQNRAEKEAKDRKIDYDFDKFLNDAIVFTERYRHLDVNKDRELEKQINDFQGLYLTKSTRRSNAGWVIVTRKIFLLLKILKEKNNYYKIFKDAVGISEKLLFLNYSGEEKIDKIINMRRQLIENFTMYTDISDGILKGKTPQRIFWEIISIENFGAITGVIEKLLA